MNKELLKHVVITVPNNNSCFLADVFFYLFKNYHVFMEILIAKRTQVIPNT